MKKFIKNNSSFLCEYCGVEVPLHPSSSRDHCTNCLWGKHVDIMPGDRLNKCQGALKPIGIIIKNGKTKLVYRCEKCFTKLKCVTAEDDNKEKILELSKRVFS